MAVDLLADDMRKAASHHQKIVVIDDCLAFCGGIDMTSARWDTREHLDVGEGYDGLKGLGSVSP